jgi:hypothetical protein
MNTTSKAEVAVSLPVDEAPGASDATPTSGSTDPREFLVMRARQRAARARVRRWKRGGLALGAAALIVAGLTWRGHRSARVAESVPVRQAQAVPAIAAPVPAPPPEEAAAATAVALAPRAPGPCDTDFSQRQWRAAIESCTGAFEAAPDAAVALRIAHASWAHGNAAAAGTWAARAVAMGSADPDAFVLIGHSERQAGHRKAATAAYRRYLRQAPRGWHAGRVRAALRAIAPRPPSQAVSSAEQSRAVSR